MKRRSTLIELLLPEFESRHLFITKLRVVLLVGFWAVFLFFLRDVFSQLKMPIAIMFGTFLGTGIAYANVMRRRWLFSSFMLELASDLTALTMVLYLTGGPYSPYFTIYLLYVLVAGILYNHRLAAAVAAASAAVYGAFQVLCRTGIIPPLILDYGDRMPIPAYTPLALFLMAMLFLAISVYTVKIASFFSQRREHILERRNRELTALSQMSSTIRSVMKPRMVIEQLLAGLLAGLNFETVVLVEFDRAAALARLWLPKHHPRLPEIEEAIGMPLEGLSFPIDALQNAVMRDVFHHRIVFRREIRELLEGLEGILTPEQGRRIQEILRVRRIVIVPLVAESETLGALIGMSREPFVEAEHVATLEAFANQSALSLEAAMLIDRLRKVNEKLEEASRVKSEFLATMSHELRTPLTAIIGFSELLTEGVMGEISEEQREALREVLHNAADLLDLINSLLDLTKVESGRMRLELNPFDVGEVLRRVASTLVPLVQKKRQELVLDLPKEALHVTADERKVQQVLLNLLANANKFTPDHGHISVSVRRIPAGRPIDDAAWQRHMEGALDALKEGAVEIVVADDGIGVPEAHQERIFDMFHQADSSSTRSFGGTGLGLALARRFVEMHGGRIWVESEFGRGARFTVVLPATAVPQGA